MGWRCGIVGRARDEFLYVGRVIGAHGIRGEVKIYPMTATPERYFDFTRVFVKFRSRGGEPLEYVIEQTRIHKNLILLKLSGCDDRTSAEGFKGAEIFIPRSERKELPEGDYYLEDLIGCTVQDGEGRRLGEVVDFLEYSGNGLLAILLDDGSRRLEVPFAEEYVHSIDLERRLIVLEDVYRRLLEL